MDLDMSVEPKIGVILSPEVDSVKIMEKNIFFNGWLWAENPTIKKNTQITSI